LPENRINSDEELANSIQNSDPEAFKELYYRYFETLYLFLRRKTHNSNVAEDLVQELFLRLWKGRNRLDPQKSIKAYLFKTANNLAIDHLRRKITRDNYSLQKQMQPVSIDTAKNIDLKSEIVEILNQLPEDQRIIITLQRIEGFKYAEIAEIQNISIKTVEKKMGLALKTLRMNMKHLLTILIVSGMIYRLVIT